MKTFRILLIHIHAKNVFCAKFRDGLIGSGLLCNSWDLKIESNGRSDSGDLTVRIVLLPYSAWRRGWEKI
jgi:hypothetical protein